MRKKQLFIYIGMFLIAILAMLGITYGIRQAIRAGNLAGIDWYDVNGKEFTIYTVEELYEVEILSNYYDFEGQTIKLGADIVVNEGNAEDWHTEAPKNKWQPITEFAGTFDGQGHSISGLYGKAGSMSMGLFSETKEGCVIKDLKVLNSYFSNKSNNGVGSILGEGTGTIQQVYSDAIIYGEGESNGGFAGLITDDLVMEECWFDGQVTGEKRSNGGLIGWVDKKGDVTIDNCLNTGFITFTGTGGTKTGGFIGGISEFTYRPDMSLVEIKNSLSAGEIGVTGSYTGVAVGANRKNGSLTFENTYGVVSTEDESKEITVGISDGKMVGNVIPRFRETLVGVGGYQWTNLDFEKYWSCVDGNTPIPKCFADESLSLAGVEKKVDTSWYKKNQTEFVLKDVADFWGFAMISAQTDFDGVTVKLDSDITLNEGDSSLWRETAPEYNWFPCYSFSGIFDGQGHTISGVYCYTNGRYIGMFKQINANGTVGNFKLLNSYFRGTYCVGSVSGHGGGTISDIYTDAIVENTKEHTGGIHGAMNQPGSISNCWFDGVVYGGTGYTGGITSAAMRDLCTITHCLNTGIVHSGSKGSTGGLVGIVNNGMLMSDCLNAGIIDTTLSTYKIGSVIGQITNDCKADIVSTYTVKECYDTSVGQGWTTSGAVFTNTKAQLTGNGGYQRTILDFDKYWAINKNGTPILKSFAEEVPELPNVKRPYKADINWFDEDETSFVITTPEQLYGLAKLVGSYDFEGKTIKLGKNINLNAGNAADWESSIPLNQWASINSFNGTFDGRGYTISGVYMSDGMWRVGLFGNVKEGAVIKNVKLVNSYIEGGYHMGGVAGYLTKASIDGVYSEAIVKARDGHAGGVVGTIIDGSVNNAWFAGQMIGDGMYIGGIASFTANDTGELSNCLNTGSVTGKGEVGGILGRAASKKTTIKYCLNSGTVTSEGKYGSVLGYIVADTNCDIAEGVYATKESAKKTTGNGGTAGVVIVNTIAELTGDGGYQRTILDFNKYWAVRAESTPVLKKFGGTAPSNPNAARVVFPDTSWYSAKKKTFVLNDYADLYGFAVLAGDTDFAGKTIKLGADIVGNEGTAKDWVENAPLNQWVTIGNFAGTFDGQGKTIKGLAQNNDSAWNAGLFGKTVKGAVVQNVNIKNCCFEGEYHIGSVSGFAVGTTIQNVYSEAIIEATAGHAGGITGSMDGSTLSNCWFNGNVKGVKHYAGGMTSFMSNELNKIEHCLNTGSVAAWSCAGGLVGLISGPAELTDSLSTGKIGGSVTLGSVIASISKDIPVKVNAIYGARDAAKYAVASGKYTGELMAYWVDALEGQSGYALTKLDFDKYWIAKANETPVLRGFADTSSALNLKGVDRIDISWYSADKNSFTIHNRAELLGLAYLVNSGNDFAGKTVRLGKDIVFNEGDASTYAENEPMYKWTPIGSSINNVKETVKFKGTFNGEDKNGVRHTISGLCANTPDAWFVGLFGAVDGANIKNVEIKNSYFAGAYYAASATGYAKNSQIKTVYSDAVIDATNGNSGGIAGGISEVIINNCWYDGVLTADSVDGGIAGVAFSECENELNNCLMTAKIKGGKNTGGLIGLIQGSVRIIDCLNASETSIETQSAPVGSIIGSIAKDSGKARISRVYALASAYLVAIGGNDKLASTAPKVYADLSGYNGYTLTKLDFATYWVAKTGRTPELKSFTDKNGILAVDTSFRLSTEWYDNAIVDAEGNAPGSEKNPYVLMDRADLYGFAELVNEGTTFKGQYVRLGDDIIVNRGTQDYEWSPIGIYVGHGDFSKSFLGTFDGSNPDTGEIHSISGLYTKKSGTGFNSWCAGLFGKTGEGAVIKNVKVLDSYFESEYYSGAVVGHSTGTSISNVYTDATVHANKGNNGGIAGIISNGAFSNCWFAGKVTSGAEGITGGLIGLINTGDVQITDCLNTGEVYSEGKYVGGFIGMIQRSDTLAKVTLCDSLNVGKVSSKQTASVGAAIGKMEALLYVDNTSVHTVQTGMTYAIGSGFTGALFDISGTQITSGQNNYISFVEESNISGLSGYMKSGLNFDDTETEQVIEGAWIATHTTPVLANFAEYWDAEELKIHTTWADNPTKETIAGVEVNTYIISNKEELFGLTKLVNSGERNFAGEVIYLGADIELNKGNAEDWREGEKTKGLLTWIPIGTAEHKFAGTFNGQGHMISGVYASDRTMAGKTNWYIGLFGCVTDATITDIRVKNSLFEGGAYLGTFAASAVNTKFTDLYSNAYVEAKYDKSYAGQAGGIVSTFDGGQNGALTNCWFAGEVNTGTYGYTGGLVGLINGGTIEVSACLNTGTVYSEGKYVGGFIGMIQRTSSLATIRLSNSLNVGNVSSKQTASVGAAIGKMEALLYVDNTSVHTVQSGMTYAIGSGFTGVLYNMAGTQITSGQNNYISFKEIDDIKAADGYMNTGLVFDRPETTDYVEGAWVTTDTYPILGSFVNLFSNMENPTYAVNTDMIGMFRPDTSWINRVTVETLEDESTIETYTISRPEELYGFAKLVNEGNTFANKKVYLGHDIVVHTGDAKTWGDKETLQQWTPIGANAENNTKYNFQGIFDGKGYSISGLYFSDTSKTYSSWRVGLFGSVQNATITNVLLLNSSIQGGAFVGAFAGHAENSNFTELYSEAIVKAIHSDAHAGEAGGIVGKLTTGQIDNCWNAGNVTSGIYGHLGGILGVASGTEVVMSNCLNTGSVTGSGKRIGGFLGCIAENSGCIVKLSESLNLGNVSRSDANTNVGSAVGQLPGNTHLWVEQASVRTVSSNLQYTIGTGFAGYVYNISGGGKQQNNNYILTVDINNIQGTNGVSTGLSFDDETTDVVEGYWVTTDSYPILRSFADIVTK